MSDALRLDDPRPPDGRLADEPDRVEIRPWWQNPVNLVVLAVALVVLGGGLGYVIGHNRATPDANHADIGFLHDMRIHHEQAVQMGRIYLDRPGIDGDLAVVAGTIVVGQSTEVGRMIQLLRGFGAPEASPSDLSMAWMGPPVDYRQMPGYATVDQLRSLAAATGAQADQAFVQLMVTHHQGGVAMAEHAVSHASDDEVIRMAASMASAQREEIVELQGLLAR